VKLIKIVEQQLVCAGYQSQQLWYAAGWLASKITGLSMVQLLVTDRNFSPKEQELLTKLIYELTVLKKPLPYILGSVSFCSLEILVEPPVLVPRPETEEWVLDLGKQLVQEQRLLSILDIGTGSGCIALALAHMLPRSRVIGVDIAEKALELARKNQMVLGISHVTFTLADLFPAQRDLFDVIVSNPPYISESEYRELEPQVSLWEDKKALVADDSGLAIIKRIIDRARVHLVNKGQLVLEIGSTQAAVVCTFMRSCGYTDIQVKKDFAHNDRVLMGRYEVEHEMARP